MPPETSAEGDVDAARTDLHNLKHRQFARLRVFIAQTDRQVPRAFSFVIAEMLQLGFDQKELSELLKVSRATISRWASESKLPPHPDYRELVIVTIGRYLDRVLQPDPGTDPNVPEQVEPEREPLRVTAYAG
jgi:hypothetical protein